MKYAALIFLLLWSPVSFAGTIPWEVVNDGKTDGIKVSKRIHKGSTLFEFRGEGLIEAPMAVVLSHLTDPAKVRKWLKNCENSRLLEKNYDLKDKSIYESGVADLYQIQYFETYIPWPFQNRDYILKGTVSHYQDIENNRIGARLKTSIIDWPDLPATKDKVRMETMQNSIDVRYMGPNKTYVDMQVMVDPAGNIPDWIINYATSKMPHETIQNIRAQVKTEKQDPDRLRLSQHYMNIGLQKLARARDKKKTNPTERSAG